MSNLFSHATLIIGYYDTLCGDVERDKEQRDVSRFLVLLRPFSVMKTFKIDPDLWETMGSDRNKCRHQLHDGIKNQDKDSSQQLEGSELLLHRKTTTHI